MSHPYFGPIPGADQRQLDHVAAVRAACQAAGPSWDVTSVELFATQFLRWLKGSRDDADGEVRRQILLAVTAKAAASPERDADKARELVGFAEKLYSRVRL